MAGDVNNADGAAVSAALWALPWRRPLRRPLRIGEHVLHERAGVIIAAQLGDAVGLGDACPLPGLSSDSIDDVDAGLAALEAGASATDVVDDETSSPALRWALTSSHRELTMCLLGDPVCANVASAVLMTDVADRRRDLGVTPGVDVVKLKVGRGDIDAERATIEGLRGAGVRLRLDANRALDVDAAVALAAAAGDALEFFEEPTPARSTPRLPADFPLALDETLDAVMSMIKPAHIPDALRRLPRARAWVLKPSILGSQGTQLAIDVAAELGVRVIISSAYESRVGRRALAVFAGASAFDVVHGLGTGDAFADDVMGDDALGGATILDEAPGMIQVHPLPDWSRLAATGAWRRLR